MSRGITIGKVEPINKTWLSKEEAKAFLGCSDRFLRTLKEKAEISFSKYGNTTWYELKSLIKFLENHRMIKGIAKSKR